MTDEFKEFVSFDIEIANDFPEDFDSRERDYSLLKLSIGALTTGYDKGDVEYFSGYPEISRDDAIRFVEKMLEYVERGYYIFGWNVLGFDYPVLAHASGEMEACAKLAIDHTVDPMFLVVCHKGYFLGLDKVLLGAGINTKWHTVTLNDGTSKTDMSGVFAPQMWMAQEFSAVKEYLAGDVIEPLKLAYHLQKTKEMKWLSGTGKPMSLKTDVLTVRQALGLPYPNVSWMDKPKMRWDYYSWIPKDIQKEMGLYKEKKEDDNKLPNIHEDELPF